MKNIWMVRAGQKAYLVEDFITHNLIAIGWNVIGDLTKVEKLDKIKALLVQEYPTSKAGYINISAGQIYRFRKEIVKGELVMTYNPSERIYWLGTVTSGYEFNDQILDIIRLLYNPELGHST